MAKFIKVTERYGKNKHYSRERFLNTDFIVSFIDLFKTDGEYYSQFEPKKLVEVNLQNGETLNVESTAEEILSMI